ncbi:hypothetical protein HG536_0D05770 [Torulaspora globosa]|uniref:SAPS domain-containing protein n=1 Tax=Torulaspora globosa TaxID=48254 RepID=A0A7G3ZHS0_9SACH|nr:uncharacterized protein HG536_0D05770 [Torulaspora globosa]QLL33056.1 hypothetical protein HG536_0D05770 [Torulaspora globosa]
MSFWPFGQNLNNSNVNKILDEYFSVLRSLEKSNPAVAASVQRNFSSNSEDAGSRGADEISSVDLNESNAGASRSGSDSGSSSLSSRTDLHDGDIASAGTTMIVTIQSLNSSYIERLLEEPELLNELSRQNSNLLDFICFGFFYDSKSNFKVQHLDYLIDEMLDCMDKVSEEVLGESKQTAFKADRVQGEGEIGNTDDHSAENSGNMNSEQKFLSRANLISEIFSLDIWLMTESLIKDDTNLSKIWCILKHPNLRSENSSLVPIFLKINQNLLNSRKDQYLNFIRSKSDLVDDMLKHVDISTLMDFLLKCIATDKVEAPTGIIELVEDQRLIPKCLEFLEDPKYGPDVQACAGDFLKALIAISANAPLDDMSIGPNCLTRQLASLDSIKKFVDIIVKRRGSALNITVSIVIELIRKNNSDYDQVNLLTTTLEANPPSNRDPIYLGYMLRHFAESLPSLFQIILDAEKDTNKSLLENQLREKYQPLGFERFKIVELIAELLHCSNMGLMNSKRAVRIACERDNARAQLEVRLQDALEDLRIEDRTNGDHTEQTDHDNKEDGQRTRTDGQDNDNGHDKNNYDNEVNENALVPEYGEAENQLSSDPAANTQAECDDEEIDESFEIPYVNENQNSKLRKNPTIGDLFKIKLYDTQVLPKIIELFLSHPWNNFWHNVIFDIIQQIFNGRMDFSYNSFLVYSLFNLSGSRKFMPEEIAELAEIKDFSLTKDFILQGYQNSYMFYERKHTNLGYMGHLVLIAEEVVKFSKLYKVELISPEIYETLSDQSWRFYAEDVLNDTRLMYSKILGGGNYVDDGNGNIIPHLPQSSAQTGEPLGGDESESAMKAGGLINVESLEEQLGLATESDLHDKLRDLLVANSQSEVDKKNKANGVIILGPPAQS